MKTRLGVIAAIGFLLLQTATAATLFHRYTFETNANDVAGNAHGVVMGGAVFDGAGALIFDGNNDYVQLPSGIISSLDEVSVEAWVTWQAGAAPYWQRIFDFGSQAQGQVLSVFNPGNGRRFECTSELDPCHDLHEQCSWGESVAGLAVAPADQH